MMLNKHSSHYKNQTTIQQIKKKILQSNAIPLLSQLHTYIDKPGFLFFIISESTVIKFIIVRVKTTETT